MLPNIRENIHRGFSLIELLLVIFIVSLIYFLGFSGVEKSEAKVKLLTPLSLKKNIKKSSLFQGEGTLICIDRCSSCYLRKNITSPFKAYPGKTDFPNLEVYTIDADDNLQKEEYGRYQDAKICLIVNFYRNGSSSQLILKTDKGVYFLPSYFGEVKKVDSLQKAQELWLLHTQDLSRQGDFY